MSRGRKKRQRYTAAEKVAILKRDLIEREDVSAICDEIKLHTTVFYEWQRRFFGIRPSSPSLDLWHPAVKAGD